MTNQEYIQNVLKTECNVYNPELACRTTNHNTLRLLHGAMGLATEAGELLDIFKKHIFYGKDIDKPNLIEEMGDACWYIAVICDVLGISLEEVMRINIDKLRVRFPNMFTETSAQNRDLDAERKILEQFIDSNKEE